MSKYQRILLATDFSEPSRLALAEAVRLARQYRAELHVLHVEVVALQQADGFQAPPLADYVRSLGQTSLDAAGKDVGVSYKNTVTAIIRESTEAAGILRYASEKDIDLIVMGTHGRGAVSELFMGSVAQAVARAAHAPLLVVGARHATGEPEGKPVVLAPVDLSGRSAASLACAAELAADRGAHLIALYALDFRRTRHDANMTVEAEQEEAKDALDLFVARAKLPVEVETVLGCGDADEVIFDVAQTRGASLIVLGASTHGAVERFISGSVSKKVIRGAKCPVLIHHAPAG